MALCLLSPLKPLLYGPQWMLWHPTIAFGWFAVLLLGGLLRGGNGLLYLIWGGLLDKPGSFWRRLHGCLGGLYVVLALVNIAVAHVVPFRAWLELKTFGPLLALIGFSVWAARYLGDDRRAAGSA
ncbi:septation protein IspZ [Paraburkholderia dilworthii]|uniref:septation protein IspZ n=1 Tax=Paraburkholderia dilworthii TaxID=948106 RepID=UPI002379A58F|nr:septation protein IspZ [Paraburkholderia dilworthii]